MRYLIDTVACIRLIAGRSVPLSLRYSDVAAADIGISSAVRADVVVSPGPAGVTARRSRA